VTFAGGFIVSMMRTFCAPPTDEAKERIRLLTTAEMTSTLSRLRVEDDDVVEVAAQWDDFRRDGEWVDLLAALVVTVERDRGDVDAPLPIWPDLDEAGANGRFLYLYLFALCAAGVQEFLARQGCPEHVVEGTLGVLARHVAIHRRKNTTTGVDAGWWMLLTLRGEIVDVGCLQFHRVNLGVGTLSPSPWYSDDDAARLGVGFRHGDPSIGIHIPDRSPITPDRLDETIAEAREVLGRLWPVSRRRLATCQTWMLDDHLANYLSETSNILGFQRRFTLLPVWVEDDADTLEFVFRSPGTALADLPRATTLQRAILEVLESGGHWRARTGWFDFDALP
jgi:hypothetical protein